MEFVRGSIWYVESGYSTGSEQRPGRPAIIVSNDVNNKHSSTVEMVYLTTAPKHDLPTHVTIRSTSRVSTAICEQITTVATERIGSYCGTVTDAEMSSIETAMLISLGLAPAAGADSMPEARSEETPPHSRFGHPSCRSRGAVQDPSGAVRFSPDPASEGQLT